MKTHRYYFPYCTRKHILKMIFESRHQSSLRIHIPKLDLNGNNISQCTKFKVIHEL
jgi:hypothetical protein